MAVYGKVGLLCNVVKFEFKINFGTDIKQGKYFLLLKLISVQNIIKC